MLPAGRAWAPADAAAARARHTARRDRLARAPAEQQRLMSDTPAANAHSPSAPVPDAASEAERRRATIESALARARARRQPNRPGMPPNAGKYSPACKPPTRIPPPNWNTRRHSSC